MGLQNINRMKPRFYRKTHMTGANRSLQPQHRLLPVFTPCTTASPHSSSQPSLLPSLACPPSTHPQENACNSSKALLCGIKVCQGTASMPSETGGFHHPLPSLLDSDTHTLAAVYSQHRGLLLLIHKSNHVCPSLRSFKSIPSLSSPRGFLSLLFL